MKKIFSKKLNIALTLISLLLIIAVTLSMAFVNGAVNTQDSTADSAVNPELEQIVTTVCDTTQTTTIKPTQSTTKPTVATQATKATQVKKTEPTTEKPAETTVQPTTQKPAIQFATAIPPKEPANYEEQWDAGYLIAIDNPDKTYKCGQVTLSDYDRDLLERLCMGEFGTGGFVGASLIAQSVKNAMCFDGYTSVYHIIEDYHYTGRTDIPGNEECKRAVRYIFDENHDAVQHRILYMYNPLLVDSEFHESQNYILTYEDVRFFDRWGY